MDKYDELITKMIDSLPTREIYDDYIIKDITYKEWILGMVDGCFNVNSEDNI